MNGDDGRRCRHSALFYSKNSMKEVRLRWMRQERTDIDGGERDAPPRSDSQTPRASTLGTRAWARIHTILSISSRALMPFPIVGRIHLMGRERRGGIDVFRRAREQQLHSLARYPLTSFPISSPPPEKRNVELPACLLRVLSLLVPPSN